MGCRYSSRAPVPSVFRTRQFGRRPAIRPQHEHGPTCDRQPGWPHGSPSRHRRCCFRSCFISPYKVQACARVPRRVERRWRASETLRSTLGLSRAACPNSGKFERCSKPPPLSLLFALAQSWFYFSLAFQPRLPASQARISTPRCASDALPLVLSLIHI